MSYTVSAIDLTKLTLAPVTELEDILQNVAVILSTPQGSVPLDRNFGLSRRSIDKPQNVARAMLVADITEAVGTYEPRVTIDNITFRTDENKPGKLIPILEVNINA